MDDDQYERDHAAEYQADDDAVEVLRAVAATIKDAEHLVWVGPFDDRDICDVLFTDPEDQALAHLESVRVSIRGEERVIRIRVRSGPAPILLSGALPASPATMAIAPTGRSMGGDAIWQASASEHGTAAFFASYIGVSTTPYSSRIPVAPYTNAVLSCKHVLAGLDGLASPGSPVSMLNRPNQLTLADDIAGSPIDVACATVASPDDYHFCQIRALGKIAGVRRVHRHMRVYKYGARTGLTSGLVDKIHWPTLKGRPVKIFDVRGRFACVHDSGAAVVSDRRELTGLVVRGQSADCELNMLTYVLAAAPYQSSGANDTLFIDYH